MTENLGNIFNNISNAIGKSKDEVISKLKENGKYDEVVTKLKESNIDDVKDNISKMMNITSNDDAKEKVSDIEIFGSDKWKLISKASSKSQKWMKSTKAMFVGNGCVVQVTTQNKDNVSEAVTFVPNVTIEDVIENDKVIDRNIIPM